MSPLLEYNNTADLTCVGGSLLADNKKKKTDPSMAGFRVTTLYSTGNSSHLSIAQGMIGSLSGKDFPVLLRLI